MGLAFRAASDPMAGYATASYYTICSGEWRFQQKLGVRSQESGVRSQERERIALHCACSAGAQQQQGGAQQQQGGGAA
ncbi:hypothetical protein HC891_22730, partial [Candidatus Gracilibacteria bacterium]|nr:hypothetical protein [Candidatus Gracilibacteria bacterium]